MRRINPSFALGCFAISVAGLIGCQDQTEPRIVDARLEVLSAEPITDANPLTETAEALQSDQAPSTVAVRGRVGAGDLDPFDPTTASFFISEIIEDPDGGEGHDAGTCPFCKRRAAKAPKGLIRLVDEEHQVLSVRADELLNLDVGDIIQARGVPRYDPDANVITIDAIEVHVES